MLAAMPPDLSDQPVDWKGRLKKLGLARKRKPRPAAAPLPARGVSTTNSGREGEEAAARYLEGRGVTILARNFRTEGSELDLVGLDGETLVFVEVKRRRSSRCGSPGEAVIPAKRRRIVLGARRWLANRHEKARQVRFDVVTLEGESSSIDWIQGAFDATFS
jgi:putative endonuclease